MLFSLPSKLVNFHIYEQSKFEDTLSMKIYLNKGAYQGFEVLGIRGEGPFIFRDQWRTRKYFKGSGEHA